MSTRKRSNKSLKPRKTPLQKRSAETVGIILEAAARVLELEGFEGFNTNAIARRAGASIGSLYQYFPNKDALLSGLIEREFAPLLGISDDLARIGNCEIALREYIRASVQHQMRRPKLARLIDVAEGREAFQHQISDTHIRLQISVEQVLALPDAPRIRDRSSAASDLLAIVRGIVDAAGERREAESPELLWRVEGAIWGYLRSLKKE